MTIYHNIDVCIPLGGLSAIEGVVQGDVIIPKRREGPAVALSCPHVKQETLVMSLQKRIFEFGFLKPWLRPALRRKLQNFSLRRRLHWDFDLQEFLSFRSVGYKVGNTIHDGHAPIEPDQFKDHAWFIAFAPKDHPTIAAACIIEHGGHGGSASAPVIHDVFQRYFQLNPPPPKPEIARVLEDASPSQ
jgi:hypothetical protein